MYNGIPYIRILYVRNYVKKIVISTRYTILYAVHVYYTSVGMASIGIYGYLFYFNSIIKIIFSGILSRTYVRYGLFYAN